MWFSLPSYISFFDLSVPPYFGTHRVHASPWSYPEDVVTHVIQKEQDSKEIAEDERIVNYARGPPVYDGSDSNFITKIKEDLGIQVDRYGFEEFFKDIF